MSQVQLNILQFIENQDLINDESLSTAQKAVLKSIYGLPLEPDELAVYFRGTGRKSYEAGVEQLEVTLIAGRRSGKTQRIAARIAIYEAVRDHGLPKGEEARVMLLAPTVSQARIAFRAIRRDLRRSRVLSEMVVRITREEIELTNGVTIGCHAATYDGVRGHTIVCVICDEIGFWACEDSAANPADEIIDALRPGMDTVCNAKLVKISTPFGKQGILWQEFQQRAEKSFPVWQLASQEMNPALSSSILDQAKRRNPGTFDREYLAQFTDIATSWILSDALDACRMRDRRQNPLLNGGIYVCALDPATRDDDFALAILHRRSDGTIVLDRVTTWTGTKAAPLIVRDVVREIASIVRSYGLNTAFGDQYCFDMLAQHLREVGIYYQGFPFGTHTRADIFGNLKQLLLERRIELLDHPELLVQLRHLQEHQNARGYITVQPPIGERDDLAVAVALGAMLLVREPLGPAPVSIGRQTQPPGVRVERNQAGVEHNILDTMVPGICPYEGGCANFTMCIEVGCQGFDQEH